MLMNITLQELGPSSHLLEELLLFQLHIVVVDRPRPTIIVFNINGHKTISSLVQSLHGYGAVVARE
jgi:hypothetical protein